MKTIKISMLIFAGLFAVACHNTNNTGSKTDATSSSATTTSDIITTNTTATQAGSAAITDTPSSAAMAKGSAHSSMDGKMTASGAKMKGKHHPYDGTLPQSSPYSKKEMLQAQARMGADNTGSGVTENATNVVPSKTSPNGVKVITK